MTETLVREWEGPVADLIALPPNRNVYYVWIDDEPNPWIVHYCLHMNYEGGSRPKWHIAGTGLHTVQSRDPLHLEPSIGWMECCGRHGWIREGLWVPCPPDLGWQP